MFVFCNEKQYLVRNWIIYVTFFENSNNFEYGGRLDKSSDKNYFPL